MVLSSRCKMSMSFNLVSDCSSDTAKKNSRHVKHGEI